MRRRNAVIQPQPLSCVSHHVRKKRPRVSLWKILYSNFRPSYSKRIVPISMH